MLTKNKILFWLSIGLNIFFLILGTILIARRGGIAYLVKKLSFAENIKQEEITSRPTRQQNRFLSPYYKMRTNAFELFPNTENEIIFLGDSLTDQGEWQEIFPNLNIKNRGISGDTTEGVIYRLDEVISSKPQKIFILIGTNDLWQEGKKVSEVFANYQMILKTLKQKSPQTQVFVQSLIPVNNQKFNLKFIKNENLMALNERLQQLTTEYSYQYIDLYSHFVNEKNQLDLNYTSDGVHLNGNGYMLWKELIEKYVKAE
jgi:lysophospholipase L1-like esterase